LVAEGAADKGFLKELCTKPLESRLALYEDLELIEKDIDASHPCKRCQ
jgi:hypothetical protein